MHFFMVSGRESLVLLRTKSHDHDPLGTSQEGTLTVLAESCCYADATFRKHYFFEDENRRMISVIGKPFQQRNMVSIHFIQINELTKS